MSTVLEKAVLLDETGQLIVDKLDDIKEAIGNSGEYIPLAIRVTTPPTKVSYYDGDALDLSGIVVSLVGSNGSLIDVTSGCTFSPADGATLSTSDTSVAITYHYAPDNVDFTTSQEITVAGVAPVSIAVTTPPTKTEYIVGDTLDLTGIAVTATYNNGTTSDVTASCTYSPANGATLSSDAVDTVNISYTSGGTTLTTSQSITVSNPIYGAEWDGTANSAWARTDAAADFVDPVPQMSDGNGGWTQGSSPFDNIMPWAGMERVEDTNGGTLVKIPKFYYKWTRDGAKMKLQISAFALDGFLISPAHADRGDGQGERDYVYVGAFKCTQYSTNSKAGYSLRVSQSRSAFRSTIHNLGTEIWQWDYSLYWTICMLYLVEFANWNTQDVIGKGIYWEYNNPTSAGATLDMTYHTGTTATSRSGNGHVAYRYIEDLWGFCSAFVDGIYIDNSNNVCVIKKPSNFGVSNGTVVGTGIQGYNYISAWSDPSAVVEYEFALYPTAFSAGGYTCDSCYIQTGGYAQALAIGGPYNDATYGLFYFETANYDNNSTSPNMCSRLMKLPNAS